MQEQTRLRLAAYEPEKLEWLADMADELFRPAPPIEGLTAAESRLVRTLATGRGRPMARDFLATLTARDPADPPTDKVVDVRLHHVRSKRPDLGSRIVAVRGVGLRWEGAFPS